MELPASGNPTPDAVNTCLRKKRKVLPTPRDPNSWQAQHFKSRPWKEARSEKVEKDKNSSMGKKIQDHNIPKKSELKFFTAAKFSQKALHNPKCQPDKPKVPPLS